MLNLRVNNDVRGSTENFGAAVQLNRNDYLIVADYCNQSHCHRNNKFAESSPFRFEGLDSVRPVIEKKINTFVISYF